MVQAAERLATLSRVLLRYDAGRTGRAWLARRLNAYFHDHPRELTTRTRFGATMQVDTRDLIQRYVYLFGVWEPNLTHWLRGRLRPGDGFVDVGANTGYFSLLAATLVGADGDVVAVEASPDFHERLVRQVRQNGYGFVRTVDSAVSDRREPLTLVLASTDNLGANSIVPYEGEAEARHTVEARALPELLTPQEIKKARVVKVDVEGAEGAVMRGMEPVLDRLRADAEIVVEISPDRMEKLGESVHELLGMMERHGFHTYRLANNYRAERYPQDIRNPAVPVRWHGPVESDSDIVFSRTDAATLD